VGRADIGFDSPNNEVTIISAAGDRFVPRAPKLEVAAAVLDEVVRLLAVPRPRADAQASPAGRLTDPAPWDDE
jgi:phosphopantothenoylcysteine decarboxylase / phosphopantothenate---cysteine ligase